jgi:hypothetical protein
MSTDVVLRTIGTLLCIYTVGLFVSMMSAAALNGVSFVGGSPCDQAGCHVAYRDEETEPAASVPDHAILRAAAAILVAEEF